MRWQIALAVLFVLPFVGGIPLSYSQVVIPVNNTAPCFLNYTAGADMMENCGYGEDYIKAALLPWEWITGGYFSMFLAAILVMFTYIKYHKAVYPIIIGAMMLPLSFFLFPSTFLSWAVIMAFVTIGILVWYIFIRQTKEWNG